MQLICGWKTVLPAEYHIKLKGKCSLSTKSSKDKSDDKDTDNDTCSDDDEPKFILDKWDQVFGVLIILLF